MTDFISRQDAIEAVEDNSYGMGSRASVKAIKALPSAEYSKLLQTTLNGDLISRADAIEAVARLCLDGQTAKVDGYFIPIQDALINTLNALPSAEAKTKCIAQIKVDTEEIVRRIKEEYDITDGWIPVNESLPNGQTEVIVSCIDDSGDTKFSYTSSGWVTTDKEYWIVDNEINPFVVAWMPLPKPYEGSE